MATTETKKTNEIAPAASQSPLAVVSNEVRKYLEKGRLHLPKDYSAESAMKSAWLLLQTVQDKDHKPALKVCTQSSIVNALMSMVIQALNPDKKQCYFIVYGTALTCQRSYFGDEALAMRVRPGIVPYGDVIYQGEEFVPKKMMTKHGFITVIDKHNMKWPRDLSLPIVGAYKGATYTDPRTGEIEDLGIELMGIEQIRKSWEKSKTMGPASFHNQQPDQACLRTVTRRWAKPIINASTDELLLAAVRESDMDAVDAEVSEDALEHANGEMIALPQAEAEQEGALPPAQGKSEGWPDEAAETEPEPKRSPQGGLIDTQSEGAPY